MRVGWAALVVAAALGVACGRGERRAAPGAPAPGAAAREKADDEGKGKGKGKGKGRAGAADATVTVGADGSFSPAEVHVRAGDTVAFRLPDRRHSVVAARPGSPCAAAPWTPDTLAGPSPVGASGIFTIGPFEHEPGFEFVDGACRGKGRKTTVGGRSLCPSGPLGATNPETWRSAESTGVHVRLVWNRVEPARGRFDWTALDRELDAAVAAGKLVSLSVKAGSEGTPDWVFSPELPRLHFQDLGSWGEGCGVPMDLADPTDPDFRGPWGELLDALGAHVRSRADWYRSVAYVRVGGANLFSAELRLPARCRDGCSVCNTEVWAKAGYRPSKLEAFAAWQEERLAKEFPGKSLSLQIIQAGFPRVSEQGCWLVGEDPKGRTRCLDGTTRAGDDGLPRGAEQTQALIDGALARYAPTVQIAHNGLSALPAGTRCPTFGQHPARGPYADAPEGCPNRWVLEAGSRSPHQITGFQTNDTFRVGDLAAVESALQNAWDNSDAVSVEIYEQLFLESAAGGRKLPSGRSFGDWAEKFHERRRAMTGPKTPDPFPETFRWTVPEDAAAGAVPVFDPYRCKAGGGATIVVDPG